MLPSERTYQHADPPPMPPLAAPPPSIPRVEQHATISRPPTRPKSHWLLWWKIEPEELAKQVDEYKFLEITQSARGISLLCLAFAALVTGLMAYFRLAGLDEWAFADVGLALSLGVFIYRGHKWAMIGAMIYWTFQKLVNISSAIQSPHPNSGVVAVFWWAIYMHAFYLAFKTERTLDLRLKAVNFENSQEPLLSVMPNERMSKQPSKGVAVLKICIGLLLLFVQLSSNNRGLVIPDNPQAIGFDIFGCALYLFCLWAVGTGVRALGTVRTKAT